MRYTPLKPKGKHGEEMKIIRRKVWPGVLARAKRRCEGCGSRDRTLQWSHVFGRRGSGGGLGDWADLEDLTAALCVSHGGEVGCHEKLDRHLDDLLTHRMSWDAIKRLAETCSFNLELHHVAPGSFGGLDAIRYLVRVLESEGWTVDAESVSPVRAA